MARNQEVITCPPNVWTELTNADITNITFQVLDGAAHIRYTVGAVIPTEDDGALYEANQGEAERAINTLTSLFGANRVYAKPANGGSVQGPPAQIYVDHA